jgi:hypothetical protein
LLLDNDRIDVIWRPSKSILTCQSPVIPLLACPADTGPGKADKTTKTNNTTLERDTCIFINYSSSQMDKQTLFHTMRNLATVRTLRDRALFHDYIKFLQDYLRGILGGVRLGCLLLTVCRQQNVTGCRPS